MKGEKAMDMYQASRLHPYHPENPFQEMEEEYTAEEMTEVLRILQAETQYYIDNDLSPFDELSEYHNNNLTLIKLSIDYRVYLMDQGACIYTASHRNRIPA